MIHGNIALALRENAGRFPHKRAVVVPGGYDSWGRRFYAHLTFRQLDRESDMLAHGLEAVGVTRGTRTVLMVTPGLEFAALTFALFKVGAVIVLVDPGMGIRNLGACLGQAEPEAFIGVSRANAARVLLGWARRSVKKVVTVGRRWFWGGKRLVDLRRKPWKQFDPVRVEPEEQAAILFTSGSTGVAKGAVYTHGIFAAQIESLRLMYDFSEADTDLATFPLFALFDPALGITCVIPDMDASRPAAADPARLTEALLDHGCTQMFGSPALIDNLSRYGREKSLKFPALTRVISAGAPARPDVLERFQGLLPDGGRIHTPYGATECLPVSSIDSREILSETGEETAAGGGTCVGKPVPAASVFIIRISDEAIEDWSDELLLPDGEIGEIVVRGPMVTREYFRRPGMTRLAKIYGKEGVVYHRMGDCGRFDARGRLWFCGRKSHRVVTKRTTMFTVPCEAVFNVHEKVFRSALVGLGPRGEQRPVLWVELEKAHAACDRERLTAELLELARGHEHTRPIETILFHPSFPVDVRHNAKIAREKLAVLAKERLR